MPGENLEDAIGAAERLKHRSISTVFTHLGENVTDEREARKVADDYIDVLRHIRKQGLDTHVSVKLTHLGLDLNEDACINNLLAIVAEAKSLDTMVWVDMEQSHYVDRTIEIYKKLRKDSPNIGLCLQTYLYRTENDLSDLLPYKPAIRFVKGAYMEPHAIAFKKKADVDANFFKLSVMLLEHVRQGAKLVVGTHDTRLIRSIQEEAQRMGMAKSDYEFHLLYGIQTNEQIRLAQAGFSIRVLISYGSYWFPWYVRRLAERPANVWFVLKNLVWSKAH